MSFFEWVQNLQNFRWEEDEVNKRLDRYASASLMLSRNPWTYPTVSCGVCHLEQTALSMSSALGTVIWPVC